MVLSHLTKRRTAKDISAHVIITNTQINTMILYKIIGFITNTFKIKNSEVKVSNLPQLGQSLPSQYNS
jgi:F0F1-type ATP synthase assembly protein I